MVTLNQLVEQTTSARIGRAIVLYPKVHKWEIVILMRKRRDRQLGVEIENSFDFGMDSFDQEMSIRH